MNNGLIERLRFLQRVVLKEIEHLRYSSQQVFHIPFNLERVKSLETDHVLAEKLEAYTSRFCRLQDTIGDKLLPAWLKVLGESPCAVIDNLDKAETLGVMDSADVWLEIRQLRNQMIHEYIESLEILTNALQAAHKHEHTLIEVANAILNDLNKRNLI